MFNYFLENEGLNSPNVDKDFDTRLAAFQASVERVIEHNRQEGQSYVKGINKFSDMTDEELVEYFKLDKRGARADQHCSATQGPTMPMEMSKDWHKLPWKWDWRDHDGVTPVKNQGSCGSCWTFSTVGALEAHTLIKYGNWTALSEQ